MTERHEPALVLAVGGGLAAVRTDAGEERLAKFAGRLDRRPVAGDRVELLLEADDGGRIDVIEPRRTELRRQQRMRSEGERAMKEQVLAANAECVLIVASIADRRGRWAGIGSVRHVVGSARVRRARRPRYLCPIIRRGWSHWRVGTKRQRGGRNASACANGVERLVRRRPAWTARRHARA